MGKIIITPSTALFEELTASQLDEEKKKLLFILARLAREMEEECERFVRFRRENEQTKLVVEVLISDIEKAQSARKDRKIFFDSFGK